jgi:hypothetical protein
MRKFLLAGLAAAAILTAGPAPLDEVEVEFVSATECLGNHGVYRWPVKTDHEVPPDSIPNANKVKPSDIGQWPPPRGVVTTNTPRSGREKEWFEVTGRVTLVKVEADGDLHIQLVDVNGASKVNVIVEVPVKQAPGVSPWDEIRQKVFGWTKTDFPFKVKSDRRLELLKKPVIRVEGKAFFDATHQGDVPNRRKDTPGEEVTVWEIHPVMTLEEVKNP